MRRCLTLLEKRDIIISTYRSGITSKTELAKMYGVPRTTVSNILSHAVDLAPIPTLLAGESPYYLWPSKYHSMNTEIGSNSIACAYVHDPEHMHSVPIESARGVAKLDAPQNFPLEYVYPTKGHHLN